MNCICPSGVPASLGTEEIACSSRYQSLVWSATWACYLEELYGHLMLESMEGTRSRTQVRGNLFTRWRYAVVACGSQFLVAPARRGCPRSSANRAHCGRLFRSRLAFGRRHGTRLCCGGAYLGASSGRLCGVRRAFQRSAPGRHAREGDVRRHLWPRAFRPAQSSRPSCSVAQSEVVDLPRARQTCHASQACSSHAGL